jgi:hypothetical protein
MDKKVGLFSLQGNDKDKKARLTPLLPEQLPEVNEIEILILNGRGAIEGMKILDDAPYKRIEGQTAREIADLFRQLPPGKSVRCHTPPFGLRFYMQDVPRQCSLCWECNNIYGDFQYDFDAEHSISKELLNLLILSSK